MDTKRVQLTETVIFAINEELDYQNIMAGSDRADTNDNGVVGQIVTLNAYARKAEDVWAGGKGDDAALHELRKCAAIAVRALVNYGCPRRPPLKV